MRYQSTTGLDHTQMRELTRRIEQVLPPAKPTGRPAALSVARSVLLTVIVLRHNLPQTLAADLFGVSQPTVSRTIRRVLPRIGQVLCLHTPSLPEALRGRVVIVDGTLVPTLDHASQHKANYSGKRHKTGLNVQILATLDGQLLAASIPLPGRTHDRAAFELTGFADLLRDIPTLADLGYQGTTAIRPRRKLPGQKEHTPENKIWNTGISQLRWAVEHTIAHWKDWKILASGYRARLSELPAVIRIVTMLEHYRQDW